MNLNSVRPSLLQIACRRFMRPPNTLSISRGFTLQRSCSSATRSPFVLTSMEGYAEPEEFVYEMNKISQNTGPWLLHDNTCRLSTVGVAQSACNVLRYALGPLLHLDSVLVSILPDFFFVECLPQKIGLWTCHASCVVPSLFVESIATFIQCIDLKRC